MPGPFAISDRVTLGFKPELSTAYGVIVATGNNYALRFMSETMKANLKTVQSMEITGDRQVRDVIPVDLDTGGDIAAEWSYGEYDQLLSYALGSTFGNLAGTTGDTGVITVTISAVNTITASAGTPFLNMVPGQWFRMSGMVNAANNNIFQIATVTSTVITTAATLINEVATATAKFQAGRCSNGISVPTFTMERKNGDLTQFEALRGCAVSNLAIAYKAGAIVSTTFTLMGKNAAPMQGTTNLPGTITPSLANTVMNAVSNVGFITEGGAPLTSTYFQSLDIKIATNLRMLKGIGNLGPVALQVGDFDAEITFAGYLADASLYNKYLNNTPTSLSLRMTDAAGQAYILTFPYGKYQTAQRPTGGKNQDIILGANFQALKDPVTGVSLIIDRCGAAVTAWV